MGVGGDDMNDACTPLSNLSSLADEGRTSVSQRWKQTLGRDIPANLRLELAVPILAYRIPEKPRRSSRPSNSGASKGVKTRNAATEELARHDVSGDRHRCGV